MAAFATVTTAAGWGALLMLGAACGSFGALVLVERDRVPAEWLLVGPFRFRPAAPSPRGRLMLVTALQAGAFWALFLGAFPLLIAAVESRWRLRVPVPVDGNRGARAVVGVALLLIATSLGVWSALSMSARGQGTPLPSSMPRCLVVAGPHRLVRNPMAVAGIVQGVAVGLLLGSWLVVAYALCGSLAWNSLIRPLEEDDLEQRFGEEFVAYRARVRCWIPRAGPVPLTTRCGRGRPADRGTRARRRG